MGQNYLDMVIGLAQNGEDLGAWDPNLFATLAQDPIGAEIQRYQEFLRQELTLSGTPEKKTHFQSRLEIKQVELFIKLQIKDIEKEERSYG